METLLSMISCSEIMAEPKPVVVHIIKCDCNVLKGKTSQKCIDHAITPDTKYKHCPQCDYDYLEEHLQFFVTNKICLICGEKLENKNSADIIGYNEAFNKVVESGFISENGIQRHETL